MTPNPIFKVLSIFKKHRIKALLIGGQAAILYGAAEFSRDIDFVILCDARNLERLHNALRELNAALIYLPPLRLEYLIKGHACHFRCNKSGFEDLRIDIMSKLRGCEDFLGLWRRRNRIKTSKTFFADIINLPDLVKCKKTQRDKDWFMLKRLIEVDIATTNKPDRQQIIWWLQECRTPEILMRLTKLYPRLATATAKKRNLIKFAIKRQLSQLAQALIREEEYERALDKKYWYPLRKELEILRHQKIKV